MSVSKRDIQLLIGFSGILLIVLTYFFVYIKLQDKTELIKADNVVLQQEVAELEALELQKQDFITATENFNSESLLLQTKYDSGYTTEDDIMFIADMESSEINEISVDYLNMTTPSPMEALVIPAEGKMGIIPVDDGITMFKVSMDFGFTVTYEGFKNVVRYIYSTGGRKNLESLNLIFDSGTGQLSGTIIANRYFLTGTTQVYSPASIPAVGIQVDDIFRTTDGAVTTN
jgi:hypothetical protein